jgi:hypothetical protein
LAEGNINCLKLAEGEEDDNNALSTDASCSRKVIFHWYYGEDYHALDKLQQKNC